MTLSEYRPRGIVFAEKVDNDSRIVTVLGPIDVSAGDYLIHTHEGVRVVNGKLFENEYEKVSDNSEPEEFHPAGKSVDVVTEYMRNNPNEVDRIIQEERDGASRKRITEFSK